MQNKIEHVFQQQAKKVDETIFYLVNAHLSKGLRKPVSYLFESGGKRIRPAIGMLTAEAICGDSSRVLYAAASGEIVHAASLIYDDIIDHSAKRRHRETIHLKWDYPTAILAANQLLSLGIKALVLDPKSKSPDFSSNLAIFADAWATLCEGKLLDVMSSLNGITDNQVLDIIYKKTGILFELAARGGAIYSDADDHTINSMATYGKNVGIAFQIQDDILGVFGSEKIAGKDVGGDIKEGKKTLLVSYVLNEGTQGDKKKLLRSLGNSKLTKEDLGDVKDLLLKSGALDYAKSFAHRFSDAAVEQLGVLEDSKAKQHLMEIPSYVVSRLK